MNGMGQNILGGEDFIKVLFIATQMPEYLFLGGETPKVYFIVAEEPVRIYNIWYCYTGTELNFQIRYDLLLECNLPGFQSCVESNRYIFFLYRSSFEAIGILSFQR